MKFLVVEFRLVSCLWFHMSLTKIKTFRSYKFVLTETIIWLKIFKFPSSNNLKSLASKNMFSKNSFNR